LDTPDLKSLERSEVPAAILGGVYRPLTTLLTLVLVNVLAEDLAREQEGCLRRAEELMGSELYKTVYVDFNLYKTMA